MGRVGGGSGEVSVGLLRGRTDGPQSLVHLIGFSGFSEAAKLRGVLGQHRLEYRTVFAVLFLDDRESLVVKWLGFVALTPNVVKLPQFAKEGYEINTVVSIFVAGAAEQFAHHKPRLRVQEKLLRVDERPDFVIQAVRDERVRLTRSFGVRLAPQGNPGRTYG
jgi:hypothetical protein